MLDRRLSDGGYVGHGGSRGQLLGTRDLVHVDKVAARILLVLIQAEPHAGDGIGGKQDDKLEHKAPGKRGKRARNVVPKQLAVAIEEGSLGDDHAALTKPEAGVIPTSPAMAPEQKAMLLNLRAW